jgi:hypothetical protein
LMCTLAALLIDRGLGKSCSDLQSGIFQCVGRME